MRSKQIKGIVTVKGNFLCKGKIMFSIDSTQTNAKLPKTNSKSITKRHQMCTKPSQVHFSFSSTVSPFLVYSLENKKEQFFCKCIKKSWQLKLSIKWKVAFFKKQTKNVTYTKHNYPPTQIHQDKNKFLSLAQQKAKQKATHIPNNKTKSTKIMTTEKYFTEKWSSLRFKLEHCMWQQPKTKKQNKKTIDNNFVWVKTLFSVKFIKKIPTMTEHFFIHARQRETNPRAPNDFFFLNILKPHSNVHRFFMYAICDKNKNIIHLTIAIPKCRIYPKTPAI